MSHHLLFNLSDLISMLLDAQRHVIRGDAKGADRIMASAQLLLQQSIKSG